MKVLSKMTIRFKLIILITIMLGGILCVGLLGFSSINSTNQSLKSLYEKDLTTIEVLSDARTQSRANFANLLNLIVVTDSASQETILADIDKRTKKIEEDFGTYEKTKLDETETKQYKIMQENTAAWNTVLTDSVNLATTGKTEEAAKLFKDSGQVTFENLQTSIRDLVNYRIDAAKNTYETNRRTVENFIKQLLFVIILTIVLGIAIGIIILKSITNPINRIVSLIKKTSDLDLAFDNSYDSLLKHKGEIGTIVSSVEVLRNILRQTVSKISNVSNNLAVNSGELTDTTDENKKTINQIVTAISEIAEGNGSQAETVVLVNETILSVAKNIEEVNHTTTTNVELARTSLNIIEEGQNAVNLTNDKILESVAITSKVNSSIQELTEQMEKVTNITDVINSIASQTNLLALNAAIEAARAGEAGKGFSVVADEIRSLAEGSSSAVKEITDIINSAVIKNTEASQNMQQAQANAKEQENAIKITLESFNKIKSSVDNIVKQTKQSADMLNSIAKSANEISNQTQDMASVAEESAASSEEISASSEQQLASTELIAKAANDLSDMAMELKDEISKFII